MPALRPNTSLALNLFAIVLGMALLAYASVPLYRLFCQVTGYGGTTMTAVAPAGKIYGREMKITFNADISPGLPWEFKPGQGQLTTRIGKETLTYYTAKNLTDAPVSGHATYNVVPHKAGAYFAKIECFCFTQQTLAAGEEVKMPISFYIDPSILDDPNLNDVHTITLSYTFFPVEKE